MTLEESRALIDAAVLAHRADPSEANRAALMAEMERHRDLFFREQTIEFQGRTH